MNHFRRFAGACCSSFEFVTVNEDLSECFFEGWSDKRGNLKTSLWARGDCDEQFLQFTDIFTEGFVDDETLKRSASLSVFVRPHRPKIRGTCFVFSCPRTLQTHLCGLFSEALRGAICLSFSPRHGRDI